MQQEAIDIGKSLFVFTFLHTLIVGRSPGGNEQLQHREGWLSCRPVNWRSPQLICGKGHCSVHQAGGESNPLLPTSA
jgi:hypothetical protein